jgi:hypothetical protein
MFVKLLFQLLKSAIRMILYNSFAPLRDVVSQSETKKVHDTNLHSLIIGSNCLLENFDVSIMIIYVGYWNFRDGNWLVGSNWTIISGYHGGMNWRTPKLLEKLKCESKSENNKRSWGTFPNSQHFGGKRGVLDFQDADYEQW